MKIFRSWPYFYHSVAMSTLANHGDKFSEKELLYLTNGLNTRDTTFSSFMIIWLLMFARYFEKYKTLNQQYLIFVEIIPTMVCLKCFTWIESS